ncbi:GNAT family N-acetyltransferase [Salsuginibacillus kocurii]|uniref:GNAT family N-acetyltransferase n=1 Tax=Salsuginibacillus kocurii TaxID=427078 RepID=UPI000375EFCB|nr:GNAT family N-acetyltransferase [Salsuginibacillus kocurii]
MGVTIRPMRPGDGLGVSRVHVDSWRATYDGVVPATYLASLNALENEGEREGTIFSGHEPGYVAADAENEQDILGFIAGGNPRTSEEEEYPLADKEIYELYLLEEIQKQGIGSRLLYQLLNDFKEEDEAETWLVRVLVANPCLPFYDGLEPTYVKKDTIVLDGEELEEWVLRFSIEETLRLLENKIN